MASEFHCVSIKFRATACAAVKALDGQRFLSQDAPMLPLPECDSASCRCTYQHYDDRRSGPRRDADVGLPGRSPPDGERRHGRGRRTED